MHYMDLSGLRDKVARWRAEAGLTQEDLDQECGFRPGTVGRLERKKREMSDEELIRILIATKRDLLWTLLESCGSLYKRLKPLEEDLRRRQGVEHPPTFLEDGEFQNGITSFLSGMQVVITKMAKASDPGVWAADLLLRAAVHEEKPRRERVRSTPRIQPAEES
ncbi:MAG TPA: helix-turn-helix transcriptional regulator [Thermoanaerobaculia bacterium]|nr:helix-turn-helix transcriptional regulator [Thermoanaerobaculia bacterium]